MFEKGVLKLWPWLFIACLVIVTIPCSIPASFANEVGNSEVLDAMDTAKNDVNDLEELIEETENVDINSEKDALTSARNVFNSAKFKFREGKIAEAYTKFIKTSEIATDAQKSILLKKYNFNVQVIQESIEKAEKAGISVGEYQESLNNAIETKEDMEGTTREEINALEGSISFLEKLKRRVNKKFSNLQQEAQEKITNADAKIDNTGLYFFFNSKTANNQLEKAEKAFEEGRYVQAVNYASSSSQISEKIVFYGRLIYLVSGALVGFIVWALYEKSKPKRKRSKLYNKIFSRGGGDSVSNW